MQAITTKYLGATNFKPSRYKATSESGISVTISTDCEVGNDNNHALAAKALCAKLNWHGTLAQGATHDGYVFVFVDAKDLITV